LVGKLSQCIAFNPPNSHNSPSKCYRSAPQLKHQPSFTDASATSDDESRNIVSA